MTFEETELHGAFIVELEEFEDERGSFVRGFCEREFAERGIEFRPVQVNHTFSARSGTLRGMHYQVAPAGEPKFVRCVRGASWNVIVDMRPDSPTHLKHTGVELSADNRKGFYVPEMFAHGNQALTDNLELLYLAGGFYSPDCERGIRHDDPAVGIEWPLPVSVISEKDGSWPLLGETSKI